jgi:hypothetical protein
MTRNKPMKFDVDKKYTIVLTEQEAKDIASNLFNYIHGYRGGSNGASRELLNWLGSRNEDTPSGDDKTVPRNDKPDPANW